MSGFRKSTDKEIARGDAPFKYEIRKGDSPLCMANKSIYNETSKQIFNTDVTSKGSLLPSIVANKINIDMAERAINKNCNPDMSLIHATRQTTSPNSIVFNTQPISLPNLTSIPTPGLLFNAQPRYTYPTSSCIPAFRPLAPTTPTPNFYDFPRLSRL